jgi:ubiquitin carboxyl-terminal hydrolase 9/13
MVCSITSLSHRTTTNLNSYCNSVLQCLYYSAPFREQILSYPQRSEADAIQAAMKTAPPRPPLGLQNGQKKNGPQPTARNSSGQPPGQQKPEDKDSPEYKKKQALIAGPILNMGYQNAAGYEMSESLFTALKDIFEAVVVSGNRSGIISPSKFLETLRKENEMFRSAMHQDAHEFLNLLLNAVMENMESHDKVLKDKQQATPQPTMSADPFADDKADDGGTVSFPNLLPEPNQKSPAKMIHELFEGKLTSETRCLTCENTSQRDEPFLDLSVDLEQHSSVTACLRRFSAEEMLCERNKFHCDNCGGLQEAEKRMKIKRLPKILALHLKRFKYTEDLQRLQKLFHKVVYPYHLRLFNTTDDAEDPDRIYELYAIVVHIGGGPYHGHYVSVIKTQDRGWLLFDDEMVEPVDRNYVKNFFGDKPGLACAYVLFYQETTLEAIQKEQRMEGKRRASQSGDAGVAVNPRESAELHRVASDPMSPIETFANLDHAATAPALMKANGHIDPPKSPTTATAPRPVSPVQSKKERAKEEKAAEKARKAAEKAAVKEHLEAEKEKRKLLASKLQEAHKKQEADLKAALEASKQSKMEDDKRRGVEENAQPGANGNGSGNGEGKSLDLFRRSKSLRFGSLGKKEKGALAHSSSTGSNLARAGTDVEKLASVGAGAGAANNDSSTALMGGNGHAEDREKAKEKEKEKEKRNRFSIRKKSFGMLS